MKSDQSFTFSASGTNALDNQENQLAERLAFSRRLKQLMDEKGLLQVDIARKLGVGRDIVSKYCAGKNFPSRRNLRLLAEFLGVQPGDLAARHIIGAHDSIMPPSVTPLEAKIEITAMPDGRALLRVQQVLPMKRAAQIVDLLAESEPVVTVETPSRTVGFTGKVPPKAFLENSVLSMLEPVCVH